MKKISLVLTFFLALSCCNLFGCKNQRTTVTEYNVNCSLNGNILSGQERVTYLNDTDNVIEELKFNLFANAFRKGAKYPAVSENKQAVSYPNGESYGCIKINSVRAVNGGNLYYEVCGEDQNILTVKLDNAVYPNENYTLLIDYQIEIANVIARTGINGNTVNLANFYPILCVKNENGYYECLYYPIGDPYYSNVANYTVSITADKDYIVASSGKLVGSEIKDDKATNTYQINNARNFCLILSKNFKTVSEKVNGVNVNYYYYTEKNVSESLKTAKDSLIFFENTFGDYPYETYSVVETEFIEGGMEFTALVMISSGLETSAHLEVIVHETAHQWWHGIVGNNEIEHSFLDEGLAEYSVVLFYENHSEYGFTRQILIDSSVKTYHVFCSVYDKLYGKVDTGMTRSLKEFTTEYEYVNVVYVKGAIMHDFLRTTIGDEKYLQGIKRYFEDNKYKNARPENLVGSFEKVGADTNGFFQSFFDGSVII